MTQKSVQGSKVNQGAAKFCRKRTESFQLIDKFFGGSYDVLSLELKIPSADLLGIVIPCALDGEYLGVKRFKDFERREP